MKEVDEYFTPETQSYPSREKFDIFDKQVNRLLVLLNEFKNTKLSTKQEAEMFFQRVNQIYFDYQHQLSELTHDTMRRFEDLPEFKSYFKMLLKEDKLSEKEERIKYIKLWSKQKSEFIREKEEQMPIEAKTLIFYAYLYEMLFTAIEKLHGMVKLPPTIAIPQENLRIPETKIRAMEVLVKGREPPEVAKEYNIETKEVWANISYWKPKLEKEGLITVKEPTTRATQSA